MGEIKRALRLSVSQPSALKHTKVRLLLLLILILIGMPFNMAAQQKKVVELLHADVLKYDEALGKGVRFLVGNVKLRHGDAIMYCDSAIQNEKENNFDAYGHVHIIQGDTLHTYGDVLFYEGNNRRALLRFNVKMVNKNVILTTQKMNYDLTSHIGSYYEGGKIVDSTNVLTSVLGDYYSDKNMAYFSKDVVVTNPDYKIYSDTMSYETKKAIVYILGPTRVVNDTSLLYSEKGWYDTNLKYANLEKNNWSRSKQYYLKGDLLKMDRAANTGEGFGHVKLIDTTQRVIIGGNYGYFDKGGDISFVTDSAMLTLYDNKDSLFLHADTLRAVTDSLSKKLFKAYHGVRFFRTDLQGKCDSLTFSLSDSVLRMFNKPVLWSQGSQMAGTNIDVFTKNNRAERFEITNEAFITSREDSVKFNQVKGRIIIGYITDNKINKIFVNGNAESVYFTRDGNYVVGVNKTTSSYLTMFFKNGKAEKIIMNPSPEGTLMPPVMTKLTDRQLAGFAWYWSLRPNKKSDIFVYPPEK